MLKEYLFAGYRSIDYDIKTGLEPNELKSIIDGYDGILIRSATKLTADILENCSNLKLFNMFSKNANFESEMK